MIMAPKGKGGLGKGLDALIPTGSKGGDKNAAPSVLDAKDGEAIVTVKWGKVAPNRDQPRKTFNEDELQELIDSIKEYGMLAPILVENKGDYYEILAGERRWKAAKIAGLKEIPVTIREYNEKEI
jgi:ParB family chromosome partitioning protein